MGPKILFLNISVNYCPKLMKFDSGIDNGNLYQISKADPDLIQKADFIAICKSLYGRTVVLGGGLRSPRAFLIKKCFPGSSLALFFSEQFVETSWSTKEMIKSFAPH